MVLVTAGFYTATKPRASLEFSWKKLMQSSFRLCLAYCDVSVISSRVHSLFRLHTEPIALLSSLIKKHVFIWDGELYLSLAVKPTSMPERSIGGFCMYFRKEKKIKPPVVTLTSRAFHQKSQHHKLNVIFLNFQSAEDSCEA